MVEKEILFYIVLCLVFQEQTIEREQEREEYQREVDRWKKVIQDKEKKEQQENRLQREVKYTQQMSLYMYITIIVIHHYVPCWACFCRR